MFSLLKKFEREPNTEVFNRNNMPTSHLKEGTCSSSDKIAKVNTGTSNSNSIIQKYQEALKNSEEFAVLYQDRHVILESGGSFTCSSHSIKITPALLPTDDSTVFYGYLVEPGNTARTYDSYSADEGCDYESIISNFDKFEFVGINDSKKTISIPVESGRKELNHDRNRHLTSRRFDSPTATADGNSKKSDIKVYASIGGTIEKDKVKKVIPCTKIWDSVYIGTLAMKTNTMNSTLKFYLDQDLLVITNNLLKDKKVRKILIELCI